MEHNFLLNLIKNMESRARLLFIFLLLPFSLGAAFLVPNQTVKIPMRDQVELSADVYYKSEKDPKQLPCLLIRNPAGRKAEPWLSLLSLVQHDYVVIIQDARNAIDPEGKTLPYLNDGWNELQDGYDTVEWLARSPYCNGQIGTIGFSAAGITQFMLAPSAAPSLKCQYIGQAASSLYHHGIFPGGQLRKHQVEGWLGLYAPDSGIVGYIIGQPFYNDFWKKVDSLAVADRTKVPALHYVGWYDTFLQGTIDGFLAKHEKGGEGAKGKQKLLIGPWTHFWPFVKTLGEFKVPLNGYEPPYDMTPKAWFDYHLKGIANQVDELPAVTYYVMGPLDGEKSSGNVWKQADQWPIPAFEKAFYLTPDRKLSTDRVEGQEALFAYRYDPRDPVPTIGGRNLFLDQGPKDQRPIEERSDTVLFTSEPLEEDLEVTGRIWAKIWFSSDKSDTDLVVRLTDVYPDGKSILIADGICRTGMMMPYQKEYSPNKAQEITVDLWSTSQVFAKGHRIRLAVTSSNYPRYEKNPNTGLIGCNKTKTAIARNVVHISEKNPSRLIMPVIPREKNEDHHFSSR